MLFTKLLTEQHQKHSSHGYHMLAEDVLQETGWVFLTTWHINATSRPASVPRQGSYKKEVSET